MAPSDETHVVGLNTELKQKSPKNFTTNSCSSMRTQTHFLDPFSFVSLTKNVSQCIIFYSDESVDPGHCMVVTQYANFDTIRLYLKIFSIVLLRFVIV